MKIRHDSAPQFSCFLKLLVFKFSKHANDLLFITYELSDPAVVGPQVPPRNNNCGFYSCLCSENVCI